jgi:[acyl-carrier-protein] S-malonyltransferase
MSRDICEQSPAARRVRDLADEETLRVWLGGTAEELTRTINTQPCVFLAELACAEALTEAGVAPQAVAGFSLGELAAAAYAGILPYDRAFALTQERARLMQRCAEENPGAMLAALRIAPDALAEAVAAVPDAWRVNFNSPEQTVVAARETSVAALEREIAARGGKTVRLAVGGAFHSPLMAAATRGLAAYLADEPINEPRIPVYTNLTAEPYADIRAELAAQASSPVLWQKTIENMRRDGFDTFIEVGPGRVLSGLVQKIDKSLKTASVRDAATLEQTIKQINEQIAE